MHLTALLVLAFAQTTAATTPVGHARNPAYARDGRLAVAVDGDLWVRSGAGSGEKWVQLTAGRAWDREPAWTAEGDAIVFSSDRAGGFDLWRVRVTRDGGASGEPERLTTAPEPEGEPALAPDGRIVFVRGRGPTARLWVRAADGSERRLTRAESAERSPALSADGARLAYVSVAESGRRLRVRALAGDADSVVVSDRSVECPAWSPAGDRIAFTVGGARPGVFVTPPDGRYVNLVSARHAEPAWSPDGSTLAMATLPNDPPSYNGDPDRLGDREVAERLGDREVAERLVEGGGLAEIDAPGVPDASLVVRHAGGAPSRAQRNAAAFDRVWSRTASLYYASPDAAARRGAWERLGEKYRAAALAAPSDSALEEVLHRMQRERPPLREPASGRAVVSSAHPVATEAGLEMLRKGGNVVDAAVAVSFALGVVEPDASGVGGYGQLLVQLQGMAEPKLIEFMSRVPEEATLANASLLQDGRYPADGPVLANVPGTVAGMHAAWTRYGSGKLPWTDLLAPAIRAARDGFVVSDGLATTLTTEREHFAKYESSRALFFRNGEPLHAGDTLRNPDLAWTLEQIAKRGADGFYKGEVARRLVSDLRGKGNAMRLTDLARYYAPERTPVSGTYRGYTLYSSAPPVSGGATLVSTLNLLEQWKAPRPYAEDAATLHAMVAAWQLVPSTRGRIADPGLWPVTVEPLVSKDTARARWRCFDPARSLSPSLLRGDTLACASPQAPASDGGATKRTSAPELARVEPVVRHDGARDAMCDAHEHAREVDVCHASGTTAFAVADAQGNVVTVTQTLGTWGGNFYVTPGLGFLYNDKLTSYGTDPNQYGARLPFARHGSTLAPTIVFKGDGAARRPVFALGAAGNAWITSAVYQTLIGALDQGLDPQRALELPRFLLSQRGAGATLRPGLELESGFAPAVVRRLRELGYALDVIALPGELRMGYGAAVAIEHGRATAGADPRRSGAAGAVP